MAFSIRFLCSEAAKKSTWALFYIMGFDLDFVSKQFEQGHVPHPQGVIVGVLGDGVDCIPHPAKHWCLHLFPANPAFGDPD